MNKRINIVLPETTLAVLERVVRKGGRSRFIDLAVRHYVETQSRQSLRERLEAGYRASAKEDLEMAADWFPLEEEAAEVASNPRDFKKKQNRKALHS